MQHTHHAPSTMAQEAIAAAVNRAALRGACAPMPIAQAASSTLTLRRSGGMSDVVADALQHAANAARLVDSVGDAATIEARAAISQRARALQRAGFFNAAAEAMALAPPPPPVRMPPANVQLALVRGPVRDRYAVRGLDRAVGALTMVGLCNVPMAAHGRICTAPRSTPLGIITAGLADLPPGERRARQKAIVAAAKFVQYWTKQPSFWAAQLLSYGRSEVNLLPPSLSGLLASAGVRASSTRVGAPGLACWSGCAHKRTCQRQASSSAMLYVASSHTSTSLRRQTT